ncbi:MAG: hypothetical protein AAGJ68_12975 [Pseudomonadota bacterium]
MSASAVSAGSAWAGSKRVEVILTTPVDEGGITYSDATYVSGIARGDKLHVNLWEWNGTRHTKNADCSFWVEVSPNGTVTKSTNKLEISVEENQNGSPYKWSYKLKEGCDPGDRGNVGDDRTYLHINGDDQYYADDHHPIVVDKIYIQTESGDGSEQTISDFLFAPAGNYDENQMYSITNACAEDPYHFGRGLDNDFVGRAFNANQMKLDGSDTLGAIIFINENDLVREMTKMVLTEDLPSNPLDLYEIEALGGNPEYSLYWGATERANDPNFNRVWLEVTAEKAICAGGGWPDKDLEIAIPDDYVFTSPVARPGLPDFVGADTNGRGWGLRNTGLAMSHPSFRNDHDTLTILTYNIASIPAFSSTDRLTLLGCAWFESGCSSQWRRRRRELQEISRYILEYGGPDVLVFAEAFQDKASYLERDKWDTVKARDKFKEELRDLYDFATVMPFNRPNNDPTQPQNCPTESRLVVDQTIYPDDDHTHGIDRHCINPKGTALDSGVLIGLRRGSDSAFGLSFVGGENRDSEGALGDYWNRYANSAGSEGAASKGVRYVKVRKNNGAYSQDYHIFGTHLQSSKNNCPARVAQLKELSQFITDFSIDEDDRIILTGDLNIDPWRNNHVSSNVSDDGAIGQRAEACRNELEYLIQRLRYDFEDQNGSDAAGLVGRVPLSEASMPFSNDCVHNQLVGARYSLACSTKEAPGDKSKILDHAIWMGEKPAKMGSSFVRQISNGVSSNFNAGDDLSGHYPMLTVLGYDSSYAATAFTLDHRYTFPMMCPYGKAFGVLNDQMVADGTAGLYDGSIDLACVPHSCDQDFDFEDWPGSGDATCDPIEIAGSGAVRKYCLSTDENWTAPCIVQTGYQNLAMAPGVVADASSVERNLPNGYGPQLAIDGTVRSKDEWAFISGTGWAGQLPLPANESDWLRVTLPIPQYVKRVRVRHSGSARSKQPKLTYSLFYNDTYAVETDACLIENDVDYPADLNAAQFNCPQVFGGKDNGAYQVDSTTYTLNSQDYRDPGVWEVYELDEPVLTDQIVFHCTEVDEPGRNCGLAELEIYGGAE